MTRWTDLASGIALVATDLDGTLLHADGSVSAATVAVLERARAEDLPVVFVTGRPPRWLPVVVEATGHGAVAICANGAVLLDVETHRVLRAHAIEPEVLDTVVTTLRESVPGVSFAIECVTDLPEGEFAREVGYVPRLPVTAPQEGPDVRDLARGRSVVKLLARVDSGHDADSLLDHALEHVAHLVTVTHSSAHDVLLEMSAAGVTKASTLAEHAADLGLGPEVVAAVGDMPNDVPMLRWARVGLAVAGAHPRALAAADAVLPGPQDDGVARFVEAVLAQRS